ncbi:dihydrolipoamide dehydrogenase [Swaminathania salitolerans LMG 21291]|uniref:Dihydrolipoyl dehydrogenase n=2 Tax=Swaminathania salitolerans TaxID=182838 RepID=A0A511BRG7_9PROT|nr:dihydrolipoyl dehydrogenase [Swaminathania salitolerans]GBQ11338.1 dihydrolipoamide dehydrogenase [Swaminathania salitolerans LMG 21291]GEL02433.1 dihydrolipoyl dehydrogenase [Swaminathania salitolerans]
MSETYQFDLAVIGAGPGGYVCALKAAQRGLKVLCVDRRETPGGTCLNVGCIPSKALLHSSERLHEASTEFEALGIEGVTPKLNLTRMMERKSRVVADTVKGIGYLFRKNAVTFRVGEAALTGPHALTVGGEVITAASIVIATGSAPVSLPDVAFDEKQIVSSTGALALDAVPGRLAVIGAGVIGLELGSVWKRLGSEVTVVEYGDHVAPGFDRGLGKQFQRSLEKLGLKFHLSSKVTGIEKRADSVSLTVQPVGKEETRTIEADVVLIAIGRRAYTDGLNLSAVGIETDRAGRIPVDQSFRTSCPGIYAIGDVIAGPMLAHKAEEEGLALAEQLAGRVGHVPYDAIPSVIYTQPEFAMVGKTEEQLKSEGVAYRTGSFPFMASARARAIGATEGGVKVLTDEKTDRVLGVHILGACAGELIAEATLAMTFRASAEDIALACHAHPTLSEALKEASLGAFDRPLHL